jgi:hypothetical protein
LVHFSGFGVMHQEKSGNPDATAFFDFHALDFRALDFRACVRVDSLLTWRKLKKKTFFFHFEVGKKPAE